MTLSTRRQFLGIATGAAALTLTPQGRSALAAHLAPDTRTVLNFNREWRFLIGDHDGAGTVAFDDTAWHRIGLPHSFSMPYFLAPKFYTGYGWYRKRFDVPKAWSGKRLFLEFDGAFQETEITINGTPVGHHMGGYTGFSIDITSAARPGENVVAVRVNNIWNARVAPRAGEHVFSGGIYRDVRLVVTDPLHVDWYGTFVTTPAVSREAATVNVKTDVRNDSHSLKRCTLRTELIDPSGKAVAVVSSIRDVPSGGVVTFDQTSPALANPQLWHPNHPNMCRAVTTVIDGDKPVDSFVTPFGIRWFEFTVDRGFFLNGDHYYFCGANVHQDHAGWGDAVTHAGFERDVRLVKEAGFTFIRGSHYPKAPSFVDACDRQGALFWSENAFWGTGGRESGGWSSSAYPPDLADQKPFEQSVKDSLRDMIRVHRNHPSLIIWSMSNEAFFSRPELLPSIRAFLKDLVAYTHELDPTRPTAIGGCQRGDLDKIGDIAGYNGDGARLFINPSIPSVVSEYGSVIADRPGKYEPGWGDLPMASQDKTQPYPWRYPWRSGEAIWCAFDHGSNGGHFGCMGMLDYFRLPKREWYWYRNEYRHIPPPEWPSPGIPAGLRLTADKLALKAVDGTDDTQIVVTVVDDSGKPISNSPPVTLAVISGPGEFPTGRVIAFAPDSDIAIRDGVAAIEMRAYYAGRTVVLASSPGLPDATIAIASEGDPEWIAGVTPTVEDRPYVRYTETAAAAVPFSIGGQKPTLASSEAAGHPASNANDGDPQTAWIAADNASGAWWQVDLESLYSVSATKVVFSKPGPWRYRIEVSVDRVTWLPVADATAMTALDSVRSDAPAKAVVGRFLRVTLMEQPASQPAAIAEVTVMGLSAAK